MARNPAPTLDRPWRRPGALRYALTRIRGIAKPPVTVTDPPADINIDRDVEVATRDGTVLRINVFRKAGARPVILSIHPYGKDNLSTKRGKRWTFSPQYRVLRQPDPVTFSALTGWEAPDPAWWTGHGFAVVNADSRGCGHSDGTGKLLSRQEAEDTYDLVQWIAGQPWCDGRVVMLGVSYLAISQYAVAALQPPALRAICPWEGFTDAYRDLTFPGGVRETGFTRLWSRNVRRGTRQAYDLERMQDAHPLRDDFWRSLVPELSAITVPMLLCGSFSDNNLHSRGSVRAFTHGGSTHTRLYTHRGGKWATFYSEAALAEQVNFFRGVLDGASGSRSVRLEVREDRDTVAAVREEAEWPLARTRWRPLYLAGCRGSVRPAAADGGPHHVRNPLSGSGIQLDGARGRRADRADGRAIVGRTGRVRRRQPVRRRGEVARRKVCRIRGVLRVRPGPGDHRLATSLAARAGSRAVAAMGARRGVHRTAAGLRSARWSRWTSRWDRRRRCSAPASSCGSWPAGAGYVGETRSPASCRRPMCARRTVGSRCTGARITTRSC